MTASRARAARTRSPAAARRRTTCSKGGKGRDRIFGGGGDDTIRARRGGRDRVDCGPGDDTVYVTKRLDRVRNCEESGGTGEEAEFCRWRFSPRWSWRRRRWRTFPTRSGRRPWTTYTELHLGTQSPTRPRRRGRSPTTRGGEHCSSTRPAGARRPRTLRQRRHPAELDGVRGAHVCRRGRTVSTRWQVSTGRPDVTIARARLGDQVERQRRDERPAVQDRGSTRASCRPRTMTARPRSIGGERLRGLHPSRYDVNGDGVFNLLDFACDYRVNVTDPRRVGPAGSPDAPGPADRLLGATSTTRRSRRRQRLRSTTSPAGTSSTTTTTRSTTSSTATAPARPRTPTPRPTTATAIGSCPNCTVDPLRVGDSFVADVNRFAAAIIYATDNGMLVVQEALGTLNNSASPATPSITPTSTASPSIASAADEAAQHNNWPSACRTTILVNSVTQ